MLFHVVFFLVIDAIFVALYHGLQNFGGMLLIAFACQYVYLMEISAANKRYFQLVRYGDLIAAVLLELSIVGLLVLPIIGYLRGY